ncbi:MAG TPA: NlpC/P60 family protein [Caulobacteraceae bacterium]|nr:NlpC/P60 family protein [Caulobacteraceae bacterium]
MDGFDPRTTLAREDLADQALDGIVRARAYRATQALQCAGYAVAVHQAPDAQSEQIDQLIFGEIFDVLERREGFAWGRARRDGYVGWVQDHQLKNDVLAPTHRVSALRTLAFHQPDAHATSNMLLTLNSLVTVEEDRGRFVKVARAGWVFSHHLAEIGVFDTDPVAVAERHLGAPYFWGGRESVALDCSGLVQQALFACGRACPRDADLQEAALGHAIERENLRRGDLVFWHGHVAWMLDDANVIHATGHSMQVAVEALDAVVQRFEDAPRSKRL